MEEKIVEFSTAKLAKEKGFDYVFVNYIYCIGYADIKASDKLIISKRNNTKCQPHLTLAPTQSVLQKWLREYKDIHVFVIPTNRCIPFDRYKFEIYRPYGLIKRSYEDYETFEDALEQALIEALNLIKQKNGKN